MESVDLAIVSVKTEIKEVIFISNERSTPAAGSGAALNTQHAHLSFEELRSVNPKPQPLL
jgi:hypothetical protein